MSESPWRGKDSERGHLGTGHILDKALMACIKTQDVHGRSSAGEQRLTWRKRQGQTEDLVDQAYEPDRDLGAARAICTLRRKCTR
jgi:hypothetical protein